MNICIYYFQTTTFVTNSFAIIFHTENAASYTRKIHHIQFMDCEMCIPALKNRQKIVKQIIHTMKQSFAMPFPIPRYCNTNILWRLCLIIQHTAKNISYYYILLC